MLKFNNNHIFTGYLKQLLASLNLPKYKVYTKAQQEYYNKYKNNPNFKELNVIPTIISEENKYYPEDMRYIPYIKDNIIQHYIKEQTTSGYNYYWQPTKLHYHHNKEELNYTKKFQIKNNIYDSYTHEYLGQYLRFLRDYYELNLMPLYNCFSNNICSNLYLKFNIYLPSFLSEASLISLAKTGLTETNINKKEVIFDSNDSRYKIYMLPVKLLNQYTIAIDSDLPVELCCGFYNSYLNENPKLTSISPFTYMKVNQTAFNKPFLFNKLSEEFLGDKLVNLLDLCQYEDDLKLFIKIPQNNNSTITILEGDYVNYNNRILAKSGKILQNKSVINFDTNTYKITDKITETVSKLVDGEETTETVEKSREYTSIFPKLENREFKPITNLQLLQLNTGVSYPFADRLIEYLTGNAITNQEDIADNIIRVQKILHNNRSHTAGNTFVPIIEGLWDQRTQMYAYDYMTNQKNSQININTVHDILGYIDKDSETSIYKTIENKNKKISIAKVDIYPELYNNQYEENKNNL